MHHEKGANVGTNRAAVGPSGGTAFAVVILAVAGVLNLIWGLVAIGQDDYYRVDELVFGDLTAWGVAYMIIGVLQVVAAVLIAQGEVVGQFLGILMAAFGGINALLSVGAYPIWSITIMIVCGIIIWALAKDDAFFSSS
jgi:hypothetical protein